MLFAHLGKRRTVTNRRAIKEDNVLSHVQDAAHSRAAGTVGAVMNDTSMSFTSDKMLAQILTSLKDDKAEDIVQIDLRGKSAMADWMVIASGRSTRQVAAIAEHLVDTLKQEFRVISKVEGKDAGDWVLIDAGDIIVHLFRPEVREFYQLEKMWLSPTETAPSAPS
jgi:ribosome-associated protein